MGGQQNAFVSDRKSYFLSKWDFSEGKLYYRRILVDSF